MGRLVIPNNYVSKLDLIDTQIAIKLVKDNFEKFLAKNLNLIRVSAPMFVHTKSGLNDELSGIEKAVKFNASHLHEEIEIVQSLAKWKRYALKEYNFKENQGIYTDMNAIRKDEQLDNFHSLYVDQWDWELIINKNQRNIRYLKSVVKKIYKALVKTQKLVNKNYPILNNELAKDIYFISSSELLKRYPNMTSKEREKAICKEYGSVFVYRIGYKLKNKLPHDNRASDYDDWKLNGDILVYYKELDIALELSSMGIRVDKESLLKQVKYKNEEHKLNNPYSISILNEDVPYTIGGGVGQSRLCMFFLKKVHIGEVQSSLWSNEDVELLKKNNIKIL